MKIIKDRSYKKIKDLYRKAFPKEERAPFFVLKSRDNRADCWSIYDNENWIGFAYVIVYKNLAYLFYFAIDENQRGKEYGSRTIQLLKEEYKDKKLFLAIEPLDENANNYDQRVKRHGFYIKNGLKDLPYKIKEDSVVYSIMGTEVVYKDEYEALIQNYLGFLYKFVDMNILKE